VQPPANTVLCVRACTQSSNAAAASGRTSTQAAPCCSCWTACTTQATWLSIMNRIELWPRLVFGPYRVQKLGKPGTAVPR
jgi:hypothetical protein